MTLMILIIFVVPSIEGSSKACTDTVLAVSNTVRVTSGSSAIGRRTPASIMEFSTQSKSFRPSLSHSTKVASAESKIESKLIVIIFMEIHKSKLSLEFFNTP